MVLCVCTQTALALLLLLQVAVCNSQSPPCCEGEIKLMNGNRRSNSHEGRVEICYSGQWMTICDVHWETADAEVVCTQLGYVSEGAQAICHGDSTFGEGAGPILERVNCQGSEPLLINCTLIDYEDRYKYCAHDDDAGVRCATINNNCTEGEIQLANNSTENEGRVEICVNGFWGTMCPNNTSTLDANTICKQLGFSEYGATITSLTGRPLPIRIHDIACTGHEVKLIDCPHHKGGISCTGCNSTGVRCSYDTAPAPTGLDIVLDEQNYATISWEPPRLSKRHGKLLNYSVTCSTAHYGSTIMANTLNTTKEMQLQPYETYQCCVSGVNQAGTGFPSCKLIATNEGAPTAPPMNISWHMLNYSSILLFWQAPPTEHQNGIIREYHVELSGSNTSVHYTTEGPFLLVGNLKPNINYNSSIAAHTIMRGPLSESITILLRQEKYNYKTMRGNNTTASVNTTRATNLAESVQSTVKTSTLAVYILAITTGALVVMIVAITVVFGAAYFHKSYTTSSEDSEDEIYDTIDELKQSSNNNTKTPPNTLSEQKQSMNLIITEKSVTPEISDIKQMGSVSESRPNNLNATENSNYQPLIPPRKLNQENKYECLSPTQECILGQYENDSVVVLNSDAGKEKKDTYQSLIQEEQMGSDYQCLTGFTHLPNIPVSPPQNI